MSLLKQGSFIKIYDIHCFIYVHLATYYCVFVRAGCLGRKLLGLDGTENRLGFRLQGRVGACVRTKHFSLWQDPNFLPLNKTAIIYLHVARFGMGR